ncbi:hypothetical protein GGR25_002045 [Kaistia hirudinis]|uniref:Porin n=1 Tax=Kaistia hirudinis TaxID=1293440 RepID=A0A840AR85_9HYPH|nr:porin [Kaistia hirudinis]MBB3930995.1 hypothetical protein [Kaistia hirudinis]
MTLLHPTLPIMAALLLAALAVPAAAQGTFDAAGKWIADPPADAAPAPGAAPKQADSIDNQVCSAFGPGFVAVAGGTTCVKVGGFVKFGTSFGSSKGAQWDTAPAK